MLIKSKKSIGNFRHLNVFNMIGIKSFILVKNYSDDVRYTLYIIDIILRMMGIYLNVKNKICLID